ncbi:hypothetical protein AGR1A_Lc40077 [Agrobacterium fabacearum CFBP 5771]|nr:hypothetical protein AGR1A_Lc40077 [Agrobacterium fabacearum CFBP 5771]
MSARFCSGHPCDKVHHHKAWNCTINLPVDLRQWLAYFCGIRCRRSELMGLSNRNWGVKIEFP